MKIIKNKIIPFGYSKYINIFGIIFTKSNNLKLTPVEENHELIHNLQGKYLLWIFFYLIYLIEWIIKLIPTIFCKRGRFSFFQYTYRSVGFEQVAYYNEDNLDYLKTANPYEWINYLFKMYKID